MMNRAPAVLMICAHEPTLDPRIRWEAEWAVRRAEVTVLGFNDDKQTLPKNEFVGGYRIIRLARNEVSALYYFWRLKDVLPRRVRVALGILAVLLWPILLPAEILLRLAVGSARLAVGPARRGAALLVTLEPLTRAFRRLDPGRLVRLLTTRPRQLLAMLGMQFGSAVSLFWNHLRDMPEKPDVVHCNDLDTLLVGVLAKQRYGCRLVFDAHEYYPRSDPQGTWLEVSFFSLLEGLLISQADAVVTVNPPLAEVMRKAYGLARVYAVPNAEPWIDGRPPPAPDCEMQRLAGGRVKFLYQGLFTPGRGIDELIEIWPAVDGSRAALFLRGPDNIWRQQAMRGAARIGVLERSVYFLDPVSEDELISAAAEADVGVVPYLPLVINNRLCCPNKLSQYLHAGLMVIANDLPYVNEVLQEAGAGLAYDSNVPSSLAGIVRRITTDPTLLQRSRENALHFARERFNWQAHATTFDALYWGGDAAPDGAAAEIVSGGRVVRLPPTD